MDLRRALIFALAFVGVGVLCCFFSGGVHVYNLLVLPRLAPNLAFCVILWIAVHIMLSIALETFISSCRYSCTKRAKAVLFIFLSVVIGYMWMPLFFGMNAFLLAFGICVLCAFFTFSALKILIKLCPLSALLVAIYFLYLVGMIFLTFCVMILN